VNDDAPTPRPNQPITATASDRAPAPTAVRDTPVPRTSMPALTLLAADDALVCVDELCAPVENAR